MLTQQDLNNIGELIDTKLDEKVKFLPTKEEFFSRMDTLSGEIKKVREFQELHAGQHSDNNDRFTHHHKRLSTLERVNKLPVPVDD